MKTILKIEGLHCASCKAVIEDVASEFPQIRSADVHVEVGLAKIEHEDAFDLTLFIKEINNLGQYTVIL